VFHFFRSLQLGFIFLLLFAIVFIFSSYLFNIKIVRKFGFSCFFLSCMRVACYSTDCRYFIFRLLFFKFCFNYKKPKKHNFSLKRNRVNTFLWIVKFSVKFHCLFYFIFFFFVTGPHHQHHPH